MKKKQNSDVETVLLDIIMALWVELGFVCTHTSISYNQVVKELQENLTKIEKDPTRLTAALETLEMTAKAAKILAVKVILEVMDEQG